MSEDVTGPKSGWNASDGTSNNSFNLPDRSKGNVPGVPQAGSNSIPDTVTGISRLTMAPVSPSVTFASTSRQSASIVSSHRSYEALISGASSTTSLAHPASVSASNTNSTIAQSSSTGSLKGNPSQYVKLNVGGSLHYTTIGTLTKGDNMLRAMFSGRMEVLTDTDGWILIDRHGKHFGTILNFLRDGNVPLPETRIELSELRAEAKYFCVDELADACEKGMKDRDGNGHDVVPVCRVPLITSQREEQALINACATKPVVKLLINRHNNKYSYTGASDDNLLKNIELFDKLSLRFSNRVLFIKDVIGSNEICCWSFYGHGKKIAEVCCTAIVYATDRKNTKVEFPEARIYEETLNCLLYENRTGPDQELMQATSQTRPSYPSDDEDAGGGPSGASGTSKGGASGSGGTGGAVHNSSSSNHTQHERSGLARLRSSKHS